MLEGGRGREGAGQGAEKIFLVDKKLNKPFRIGSLHCFVLTNLSVRGAEQGTGVGVSEKIHILMNKPYKNWEQRKYFED